MMKKEKNNIKKGILIGCGISALLLAGFLGSYAYFIGTATGNKNQEMSIQAGKMELIFADGNSAITKSLEFGSSIEKTFTIENTGSLDAFAKINFEDLVNTYLESSLTYTLSYSETEDGTYSEVITNKNVPRSESSSKQVLADNLIIPAGTKYFYKLTITLNYLEDVDQTEDLKAILSTHFTIEEGEEVINSSEKTLANLNLKLAENNTVNFASAATTDETANGLYSLEDDYGTSYYFRGAVENNYVKFAGFYWRIIRINGDGSLRIIYDGTEVHANGEESTDRLALLDVVWNMTNSNDAKYVGYMYGGPNGIESTSKEQAQTNETDTNIKTQLESWYKTNIKDKGYDNYVSDSIFCNDRSTPGKEETGWSGDTGLGYGPNVTLYGSYARLYYTGTSGLELTPQFTCPNKNDAFTVSDTEKGNGALNEKVGLITADEAVAGGHGKLDGFSTNYYLFKGKNYITLSPNNMDNSGAGMFFVFGTGKTGSVNILNNVAPVISLTPEYVKTLIGDGTMDNPYRA